MKYYRLLTKSGYFDEEYVSNKIYPENWKRTKIADPVKEIVETYPSDWIECSSVEYYDQEQKLPDNWYVVITEENVEIIKEWFDDDSYCYGIGTAYGIYNKHKDSKGQRYINMLDWKEISFTLFKKLVLKQEENVKEIIGYICPTDLWGGDVKKGSIFTKDMNSPTNYTYNKEECFRIAQEIVETWEPVYKEEFKVGDWVYSIDNTFANIRNRCVQIDEITTDNKIYCKDFIGRSYSDYNRFCKLYRKATREEIKEALLKEAKKKFPIGTKFRPVCINGTLGDVRTQEKECYLFDEYPDDTWIIGGANIYSFKFNKWAEVFTEPKVEIKGYKAEFTKDFVSFGCQTYSKDFILKLNNCLQQNGFSMDYKNEIKQMADYFNK
jgi:hypothetical protein